MTRKEFLARCIWPRVAPIFIEAAATDGVFEKLPSAIQWRWSAINAEQIRETMAKAVPLPRLPQFEVELHDIYPLNGLKRSGSPLEKSGTASRRSREVHSVREQFSR